jgi:hypothetical protein
MSKIQKYSEFTEQNEGLKSNIVAGLVSLFMSTGMSGGTTTPDDSDKNPKKVKTQNQVVYDKQVYEEALKKGWKLTKMEVDTLWDTLVVKAPETKVVIDSIKIPSKQGFSSGSYDLSAEIKSEIKLSLDIIKLKGSVLIGIDVIASTDKQKPTVALQAKLKKSGFTPDNEGLSKARSGELKKALVVEGINPELIHETNLADQGKHWIDDSDFRYVYINFTCLEKSTEEDDEVKLVPRVKTSYAIERPITPTVSHKVFNKGKIKHVKKGSPMPCPLW